MDDNHVGFGMVNVPLPIKMGEMTMAGSPLAGLGAICALV
jgi:hypothetical protein